MNVAQLMKRNIVSLPASANLDTAAACMEEAGIRHLPITENGVAIGVISVRDLLGEAVAHHAKVIGELERERMTMLTSMA